MAPSRALLVRPQSKGSSTAAPNRFEHIYAGNADLVRRPRSYESDRPRQVLRWLSTQLKETFKKSIEVQCYYNETTQKIVVASNKESVNQQMRDFFARGNVFKQLVLAPTEI